MIAHAKENTNRTGMRFQGLDKEKLLHCGSYLNISTSYF